LNENANQTSLQATLLGPYTLTVLVSVVAHKPGRFWDYCDFSYCACVLVWKSV